MLCRNAFERLYYFGCFVLACYFVFLQFEAYISNKDSTSVSYKDIIDDKDASHPTFTICLFGPGGKIFKPDCGEILSCYDIYFKTISGQIEDHRNLSSFDFDTLVTDISKVALDHHLNTKRGAIIRKKNRRDGKAKFTFDKAYQNDPEKSEILIEF